MNQEIIAGGFRSRIDSEAIEEIRKNTKEKLLQRYDSELKRSGLLRRFWIRMKIRKEVNRVVREEYKINMDKIGGRIKL
ncbi:hypothetical protein QEH56_24300 [Pelagicoccus enzymogenes]|uniref:hypothetical protein n=1 Tax=Pelagicoccus enzymogenes TaxID=2773457 RepID=UPI0028106159|nr:hypothetical protein [Pelagicoccus enzymogenes]MDQ8201303.1 hypothetical protein [Pelagicoccus enzymogenes]